jgi:thymidylate kinase
MLIVEGIDGVGKTTIVSLLKEFGMNSMYYDYDPLTQDLIAKYKNINIEIAQNGVSDRSFISELVYGPVIRGQSRLSLDDYNDLLIFYASLGTNIVYLKADLLTLINRKNEDPKDHELLNRYFISLNEAYDKAMRIARIHIPVLEFDTVTTSVNDIFQKIIRIKNKRSYNDRII